MDSRILTRLGHFYMLMAQSDIDRQRMTITTVPSIKKSLEKTYATCAMKVSPLSILCTQYFG